MGVVMVMWLSGCFKILPFAVMQRIARVRQRQLSYLSIKINAAIK